MVWFVAGVIVIWLVKVEPLTGNHALVASSPTELLCNCQPVWSAGQESVR